VAQLESGTTMRSQASSQCLGQGGMLEMIMPHMQIRTTRQTVSAMRHMAVLQHSGSVLMFRIGWGDRATDIWHKNLQPKLLMGSRFLSWKTRTCLSLALAKSGSGNGC